MSDAGNPYESPRDAENEHTLGAFLLPYWFVPFLIPIWLIVLPIAFVVCAMFVYIAWPVFEWDKYRYSKKDWTAKRKLFVGCAFGVALWLLPGLFFVPQSTVRKVIQTQHDVWKQIVKPKP